MIVGNYKRHWDCVNLYKTRPVEFGARKYSPHESIQKYFRTYTVRHPFWQLSLKYSQNFNTETTWSCNMSYERKFCGLSEYVRLQNVRPLIKSIDRSKWDSVDFGKWPNSQIMVNLRSLSTLCKLPWSMTINMRPI